MLNINISSPSSIMEELKTKFKDKRLEQNLTQEGLSSKSGVSLGSLKRFESTGQISLESLLKISLTLDCLEEFRAIANKKEDEINSLDDLYKKENIRKRGRIK